MEGRKLGAAALLLEAVLIVAAAFGGPHGTLGAWPWALQLPGILLVFYPAGGEFFLLRVGLMALIQTVLWFLVLRTLARAWRARGLSH